MLTDSILIGLFLIIEILLWRIPWCRRKNGNFMIAIKTVPLGIIALLVADWLIQLSAVCYREWRMEEISIPFWIRLLFPIFVALSVMIGAGVYLHRRWRDDGTKYNPVLSICIFFPALIGTLILSVILNFLTYSVDSEWHYKWLDLGIKEKIALEQKPLHPFLAEYDYRLRFVSKGQRTRQWLFTNTGGRTHFNIYALKDGRFLFRERHWDYLVDPSKHKVSRLEKLEEKLYAAAIPNENVNSWSGPYRKDNRVYMDIGDHSVPAEDVTGILDDMKYSGCILDRFYSAEEKPEQNFD